VRRPFSSCVRILTGMSEAYHELTACHRLQRPVHEGSFSLVTSVSSQGCPEEKCQQLLIESAVLLLLLLVVSQVASPSPTTSWPWPVTCMCHCRSFTAHTSSTGTGPSTSQER
jgi:hypothetical protein